MRRLLLLLALLLTLPSAAQAEPVYDLANGCYAVAGLDGAAQVRMKPTALGRYLLYRPDGTFATGTGPAAQPGPAADFAIERSGGSYTLTPAEGPALNGISITPASGCAEFPEVDLDATGTPKRQAAYKRVGGFIEGHMHWMTFEYFGKQFHCGQPWHPYGVTYALPDCSSIEGPQGTAAPFQNFLNFGNPAQPHDTSGWPELTEWGPGNLTYEGTYYRWVERAYLAGLRLMVMGVNENRVLCELQARRETNCNEMDTVRRGFASLRKLQDYVDAQAGGPGKGFFQIVTDPFQAREVINSGRMAVVLEIEISEPFDCRGWEQPTCDREQVDRQLDEMYELGVRSSLLLNKFDNPLTGVRFDSGPVGVLINAGNRQSAGTFFSAETCQTRFHDNTIETFEPNSSAGLDALLNAMGVPSGTYPAYPPAPHCNTRGLTDLGKHVVNRMMDLKMIVNPDHMSQAAVSDTLSLLEARDYSGVISPHGWVDPGNWPRLWKLGGMAFPGHSAADDYVEEYQRYRPRSTPYLSGWGYGADLGGLSHQPDPTGSTITYPFKSYDGRVTFEQQTSGERTFDYNTEGVTNYGAYAEWFEDLRRRGGDQMMRDMWDGAEAYLEMWERASGVRRPRCARQRARLFRSGRGGLKLGSRWQRVLRRSGQPQQRGRAWSYCVLGPRNEGKADVAVFSKAGRVQLVGSTAFNRKAGGVKVGSRAKRAGIHRRGRFVSVARRGRVVAVAVTKLRGKALRTAVRRVLRARATRKRPKYQPSVAESEAAGTPPAGT